MIAGCERIDVFTEATTVQLETSLIAMMNTADSYVCFTPFFDIP